MAKKKPVGRPPLFKTAKELQDKADEYFALLKVDDEDKDCNQHLDSFPTLSGLAYFLGFCDRASFYDYEKKPEFSHTIKTARMRVENWYEMNLMSGSPTGAIFALKNLGWKDKQEQEITANVTTTPTDWMKRD